MTRQLDLFAPKPRNFDEARLIEALKASVWGTPAHRVQLMTPSEVKRLMTPLPRVTVND